MFDPWVILVLAIGVGAGIWFLYERRQRALSVSRLAEPFLADDEYGELLRPVGLAPRNAWLVYAAVAVLGLGLWLFANWAGAFCLALVLIGWIATSIALGAITKRRAIRLETQLAEAIDLIVGALHAGAGTLDALDSAARESREPLRSHLKDLVGAIRLGDSPQDALEDLYRAVPLESYRLFSFTLSVHEETGGSLAPTLTMVARSIRDNVDLKRRIHAETTQAHASVFGIIAITYGIALVTWRTHPDRMEGFVNDYLGIRIIAAAVVLQALGLFWMTRMTKIRY
jgi:Flp pilus assembly protein TadB